MGFNEVAADGVANNQQVMVIDLGLPWCNMGQVIDHIGHQVDNIFQIKSSNFKAGNVLPNVCFLLNTHSIA